MPATGGGHANRYSNAAVAGTAGAAESRPAHSSFVTVLTLLRPTSFRLPLLFALALALPGCMVVTRTTSAYNADCQVTQRRVTLEAQQVGAIGNCRNNAECTSLLAVYGLLAAGSAVVSGSVAVVGNVAYWLEEKAQCVKSGADSWLPKTSPAAQPAVAASAPA